jgi:ribonuclease J
MVVMDSGSGKLIAGPEIHARGFVEDDAVFDEVRPLIEDALAKAVNDGNDDVYQLQQVIRRTTGRWVNQAHRRRPMIIPVVLEA